MGVLNYKTRRNRRHRLAAELYATWTPRRLFTFGTSVVGGAHWFTDPNLLYRRRNFHTYTNAMNAGGWTTTTATVTPNAAAAPDGTSTASLVTASSTAANQGFAYQSVLTAMVSVRSGVHTLSAYWKAGSSTGGVVQSTFTADSISCGAYTAVNASGVVTAAGGYGSPVSGVTGGSESVGDGWYRVWVRFTLTASSVTAAINRVSPVGTTGEAAPCTAYFWGVQFERGELSALQPVPTTWPEAYLAAVGAENIYAWVDNAGTTPTTAVGDTIGLSLDRAYGGYRGANMAAATYASPNDTVTTVVSATAFTQTAGTAQGRSYIDLVTVANKTYELTATVTTDDASGCLAYARASSGGGGTILATSNAVSSATSPNTQRLVFTATGAVSSILWSTTNTVKVVSASNISIREIPGTHPIQATSTARPTLSARVNQVLSSQVFSIGASWATASGLSGYQGTGLAPVLTPAYGTAPDGTPCTRVVLDLGAGYAAASAANRSGFYSATNFPTLVGSSAVANLWLKPLDGKTLADYQTLLNTGGATCFGGLVLAYSPASVVYTVHQEADGWLRINSVFTNFALTTGNTRIQFVSNTGNAFQTLDFLLWKVDARHSDDAAKNIPVYQRVGATAADHDTDGFPHYALFDGTDDSWASAATVDGSGSDKATVIVGATKNSDAAVGYIVNFNLPNTNDGSFSITAPPNAGLARFGTEVRGTTARVFCGTANSPYFHPAPISAVVTAQYNTGTTPGSNQCALRVNGPIALAYDVAGPTSPGNFGNATFTVGTFSAFRFNGRLYSLVFRFGAMGEADRNRLEQWNKNLMRLP